jgi:hypothetical protein
MQVAGPCLGAARFVQRVACGAGQQFLEPGLFPNGEKMVLFRAEKNLAVGLNCD